MQSINKYWKRGEGVHFKGKFGIARQKLQKDIGQLVNSYYTFHRQMRVGEPDEREDIVFLTITNKYGETHANAKLKYDGKKTGNYQYWNMDADYPQASLGAPEFHNFVLYINPIAEDNEREISRFLQYLNDPK